MILKYLSELWLAITPAAGNHLWQSTLFALTTGLLTLLLRENQARIRYWLWLAASLKFLIPFSVLIVLGSHLSWPSASAESKAGFYFTVERVGQPFTQLPVLLVSRANPSPASFGLMQLLPAFLAGVWLCGFLVVVLVWFRRCSRISKALRHAHPLLEGREVETLRRLERIARSRKLVEMFLSRTSLELGIFAITRPVWCGRRESPNAYKMPTSKPFSRTNSGTCAVATISSPRFTCLSKPPSGFIRWFGGWVPGLSKNANAPATKQCWNRAAIGKSMPRVF